MKITVKRPVEINVYSVGISVPVKYGDEEMPLDFPFRTDDTWSVRIEIDTGKLEDWPPGTEKFALFMKVADGGTYTLYDDRGEAISTIQDYVPDLIPGEYGDYICLKIAEDGTITNWPKNPTFKEFFRSDEDDPD